VLKTPRIGSNFRAMKHILLSLMFVPLAACAGGDGAFGGRQPAEPEPVVVAVAPDTPEITTPEGEGRFMGFTVASLGDASVPGFWIETPLVTEEGPGRVVAESGLQLVVMLRPSGGARNSGSRLSLAAFQELGIALSALPTLTVISDA
jgi:hypothetical protein